MLNIMVDVAGVDEAGRGAVIGPLVVAAVLFPQDELGILKAMGVKDSKRLSPKKREALAQEIRSTAKGISYFDLQPWAIDNVVKRAIKFRKLNYLEMMAMAKVILDLHPDKVYIDTADVLPKRCASDILRVLTWKPEVICEKKADTNYPVVSAASILAKVRRDGYISELKEKYGDLGSGYPSDRRTVSFLAKILDKNVPPPDYVRSSWYTIKKLQDQG